MKSVVVFYSLDGNTKCVAKKIAEKLGADIIELKPVKEYPTKGFKKFLLGGKSATFKERPQLKPYEFDEDKYDTVIIGTPIWAGKITPPVRTFLSENVFSGKHVAAFVTCGGGKTAKAFESIRTETRRKKLVAELELIDPLKPGRNIDVAIGKFCKKIQ